MIERLTGVLAAIAGEAVVVDVGGVGFLVEVSAVTLRDLPAVGAPVMLLTHLQVREDALQLYGFSTEEERELFRLFLGVSKIGPKLALAALSLAPAAGSQAGARQREMWRCSRPSPASDERRPNASSWSSRTRWASRRSWWGR